MRFLVIIAVYFLHVSLILPTGFDLKVEASGFPSNEGKAFISVFRDSDEFPVYGKQFKGMRTVISGKLASTVFDDLPPGTYAVAVFHDKNGNGRLDRNLLGIPTEHYGFSNDAREMFSAPSFTSAAFNLKQDRKITILVK